MSSGEKAKTEIITFKADEKLLEAMKGVPNRSEFIRNALLAALENTCPLCGGSGQLSVQQRKHLDSFCKNHSFMTCKGCKEIKIVCGKEG